MKRQLCCLLYVLFAFSGSVLAAPFAEDTFSNVVTQLYYIEGELHVEMTGAFTRNNAQINVVVAEAGADLKDLDAGSATVQNAAVVYSGKDGSFHYDFVMQIPESSAGGEYKIYLGAPAIPPICAASVFGYGKDILKAKLDALLSSGLDGLIAAISKGEFADLFSLKYFPVMDGVGDEINKTKYAKLLHDNLTDIKTDGTVYELYNSFRDVAIRYAVLQWMNENKAAFGSDGDFLYADFYSLGAIDAEKGVTLYYCYQNWLTAEGRALVQSAVTGKAFDSFGDFEKAFAEYILLYGLEYHAMSGYGHSPALLTTANRKFAGFDNDSQTIPYAVHAQIAAYCDSAVFASISELERFINNAITDISHETGGGNGSGGKGASPYSAVSVDSVGIQTLDNQQAQDVFKDLSAGHWAAEAVANLKSRGIVSGDENGMFRPDALVTREEFVKMICIVLGAKPYAQSGALFHDVSSTAWYYDYIRAAYDSGLISGVDEHEFGVGQPVLRQDLCVILMRAGNFSNGEGEPEFNDKNDIGGYALESVKTLSANGIINGYEDGSFKPLRGCTRAEAANILYKYLKS